MISNFLINLVYLPILSHCFFQLGLGGFQKLDISIFLQRQMALVPILRNSEPNRHENVLRSQEGFHLIFVGFCFRIDLLEFLFRWVVGSIPHQQCEHLQTLSTVTTSAVTCHLADILVNFGGIRTGASFRSLCCCLLWFTTTAFGILVLDGRGSISVHSQTPLQFSLVSNSFSFVLFEFGTDTFSFFLLFYLFSFSTLCLAFAFCFFHLFACLCHLFAHKPAPFFLFRMIDLFSFFSFFSFGLEEFLDFQYFGCLFFGRPGFNRFC
mmetsp:Transcript_36450/g.41586  ORF Transcript_36450/g.41586 Transcript_36450/m.41586 type:complete len:266 (+) Transcript_36450:35-832(+)